MAINNDYHPVIAGELVYPADEDDIAPGVIEYYPYRPPALSRAGSAAMIAAGATARTMGASARGTGLLARWFGHGARAASHLGWRYVRAHDHIEALGGMNGPAWRKILDTRVRRWKFLGYAAATLTVADLAAWWALVDFGHLTALGGSYAVAPGAEAAATAVLLGAYGRYRLANQVAPQDLIAAADADDGEEPFPLAWCQSGDQVIECVGRALAAEGVGTRQVGIIGHRKWGWEVDIDLKGATPGKVNAVADQLDAHFDVARGGTLIEPDPQRSAHITLRLVTNDPFADMPAPAVHAPNSLSVKDLVAYGRGMDGSPLEFRLRGMSMLVIGATGSAKTKGALRCLLEAITSCRDAIAIEMDPVKDGLTEFEGVLAAPPIRGGKACIEWLSWLVSIAIGRAKVKTRKKMGDLWEPSPEDPSIFAVVDEFIYLPPQGKSLAIELLRIGREVGVHLIFAAQEATEDSLGDAIANSVTYRIMHASRSEDIRLVFGTGAAAMGYRPDRLVPAVDDERVYDAAKFFARGPGFLRPIQWRWNRFTREQIQQAVTERQVAGRPWFDHDTLAEAGLLHLITRVGSGPVAPSSMADRLAALGTDDARVVGALLRMFEVTGAQFLPTAEIVAAGVAEDGVALQALLSRLVPMAKASRAPVDGRQQRGWEKQVADQAAAVLFAPS